MKKLLFLLIFILSCGGGSSDNTSSAELNTNSCSLIGLPTRSLRIVNGTSCGNLNQSSVLRILFLDSEDRQSACSGTLIDQNSVMTAAHCFIDNPVSIFIILGDNSDSFRLVNTNSFIIHPEFQINENELFNDVAIIKLSESLNLNPVPILRSKNVAKNDIGSIYGYGSDGGNQIDFESLRSGEVLVNNVNSEHIVSKFNGEGSNTCIGDSGGPIIFSVDGQAAVAGVTSFGRKEDCSAGDESFYTNIQKNSIFDFIRVNAPGSNLL